MIIIYCVRSRAIPVSVTKKNIHIAIIITRTIIPQRYSIHITRAKNIHITRTIIYCVRSRAIPEPWSFSPAALKLLSSPWFGALRAFLPTGFLLRRNILFTVTGSIRWNLGRESSSCMLVVRSARIHAVSPGSQTPELL